MMRSTAWARVWSVLRLAMGGVIVAAIVAQLSLSLTRAAGNGQDVGTVFANFFSFFTILSNSASAVVLVWAALWYLGRGRNATAEPRGLAMALACVTTYMIVTGIVYNLLLRSVVLPQGSEPIPWSNETLHAIAPIFLLVDLFVGPLRRGLPWRAIWGVVAFPIAWVLYTLIRGPLVTNPISGEPFWYPYPFVNPNNPQLPLPGYAGVAVYVLGIAAATLAIGLLVVWVGRRRAASLEEVHKVPVPHLG
jgi:hypothetical protein